MNGTLTGKVAFVTGAGGGIGRAAALAFAREGASVVVADVSEKDDQETARMIEKQGGRALAVRCDVTRVEDVKAALDKTVATFGRLDFAFNNAGIEPRKPAPTADYDLDEWERIIAIDLRGVFLCMKYEIPLMLKNGGGAIVNTSSGAGVIGIKGSPAYTAAKHGVIGLTRAAALACMPSPKRSLARALTTQPTTQTNRNTKADGKTALARPPEKLAQSLEILRKLQTAEGAGAIRARGLSRTHRERLLRNGFLQEVIKGWYIPSRPDEVKGDSTAWYASFWRFCGAYLEARFGVRWCLSPEQSLSLHAGNWTVPSQLAARSPRAGNKVTKLLIITARGN